MTGHIPYLNTEYARQKDQECYDIEAREKEKALDDGEQDGNEYKSLFPVRPRTPKPDKRLV